MLEKLRRERKGEHGERKGKGRGGGLRIDSLWYMVEGNLLIPSSQTSYGIYY